MLFSCFQTIVSLAILLISAEKFVEGAAGSARLLGVSPFLIGVFILGFGTSAPEMVVSYLSATKGNPGVALGNAYGSNIANIGLVLGVTALVTPLVVNSKTLRQEMVFLVAVTLLTLVLFLDRTLSYENAMILFGSFALFVGWTIRKGVAQKQEESSFHQEATQEVDQHALSPLKAILYLILGGGFLMISSHFLVEAAVNIAQILGISDLIIGLTLVAIGTSLPELVASLMAIKKNEHALAFGNVIGSNLLNTLVVVGIAGLINPFKADDDILSRDLPLMTGMTLLLVALRYLPRTAHRIGRFEGALYFIIYAAYMVYLVFASLSSTR